jgi:hypothetical protein
LPTTWTNLIFKTNGFERLLGSWVAASSFMHLG